MKQVVVFGEVFSENVGDGVIYEAIEYLFGLKGVKTFAKDLSGRNCWQDKIEAEIDKPVSIYRRALRKPIREMRLLRRIYSAIRWYLVSRRKIYDTWEAAIVSSDAVIIGGGQLLTDLDFGFPPRVYEVVRLAKKHRKPLAFFGVGVDLNGWGWAAKYLYSSAIKYASYISCRDEASAAIIKKYLPEVKLCIHVDPAFIMGQVYSNNRVEIALEKKLIGFNFQEASHFRHFVPALKNLSDCEYVEFWALLISSALDKGYSLSIFTNGAPGDYRFAEAVQIRLKEFDRYVTLLPRPLRPKSLITYIESFDFVIATRMHAGIIAYALGNKPVAISWDKKVDNVWEKLNLLDVVVPASIFQAENPWSIFEDKMLLDRTNSLSIKDIEEELFLETNRCIYKLNL